MLVWLAYLQFVWIGVVLHDHAYMMRVSLLSNRRPHMPLRAAILVMGLAPGFAHPPAWVSRAHETGDQLLRARLFELLIRISFADATALVAVVALSVGPLQRVPPERALAAAQPLFTTAVTFSTVSGVVGSSESWGATAAAFSIVAATAAITWFYFLGKLKGRFFGCFICWSACHGVYAWTSLA